MTPVAIKYVIAVKIYLNVSRISHVEMRWRPGLCPALTRQGRTYSAPQTPCDFGEEKRGRE